MNFERQKYVFSHLAHHLVLSPELSETIITVPSENFDEFETGSPRIFFLLSQQAIDHNNIFAIENIPVLYPNNEEKYWYSFEGKNLVFNHDILKSVFYLLSGEQEYKNEHLDFLGRFTYMNSIQKKLRIIHRPVVNYYFSIILQGMEEFCKLNKINFERRLLFSSPQFFLSHDIDRVDKYHILEVIHKYMELLGLKKTVYSKGTLLKLCFSYTFNFINLFKPSNPFWNFKFLRESERRRKLRSTWYFLEKEGRHTNSRYRFNEPRIRKLMDYLNDGESEIGLHGTVQSAHDQKFLNKTLLSLSGVSPQEITGIRQHKLIYSIPETALIHQNAGLKYDSTLTFPAHAGFRNSYCHPFKLYDFENEKMIDIWQIPLTVMDGTLFQYQKLSFNEAREAIQNLLKQVKKFNGIFSLLWHNSFFDEVKHPGITEFYESLLDLMAESDFQSSTGHEIYQMIEETELQPILVEEKQSSPGISYHTLYMAG